MLMRKETNEEIITVEFEKQTDGVVTKKQSKITGKITESRKPMWMYSKHSIGLKHQLELKGYCIVTGVIS